MVSTILEKSYVASNIFSRSVNTQNATDTVAKWRKSAKCLVWGNANYEIVPAVCVCVCVCVHAVRENRNYVIYKHGYND